VEALTSLYTAAQVRELDRIAIEEQGIPGILLMRRAAHATLAALLERWPQPDAITVFCGSGNNGGDGYVLAALAQARRIPVSVVQVAALSKLRGDARRAYEFAVSEGVPMTAYSEGSEPLRNGVIVDALLGTGLHGDVSAPFASAIRLINDSGLPVIAVDVPSGLCADSGRVLGSAVEADMTVTFIGRKRGLYTARGPAHTGQIVFDDLSVPDFVYENVRVGARLLDWYSLAATMPERPRDAHKGMSGHVMIIGGDLGFGGAAIMAAEAALRTGAGLVSVATRPQHVAALNVRCPEAMAVVVVSGQELEPLLARPTVLVVGPGLGLTPWSEQMLQKALAVDVPKVLDADALNLMAQGRLQADVDLTKSVLTPHPGEAARLLGWATADVQSDRFAAVEALHAQWSATALLKGAGTLIASNEGDVSVCPYGNAGMAVGGMGDLLSGVIGALLAQGMAPRRAAEVGACLHGLAGDDTVARDGTIGLCATDLLPALRWRRNAKLTVAR